MCPLDTVETLKQYPEIDLIVIGGGGVASHCRNYRTERNKCRISVEFKSYARRRKRRSLQ